MIERVIIATIIITLSQWYEWTRTPYKFSVSISFLPVFSVSIKFNSSSTINFNSFLLQRGSTVRSIEILGYRYKVYNYLLCKVFLLTVCKELSPFQLFSIDLLLRPFRIQRINEANADLSDVSSICRRFIYTVSVPDYWLSGWPWRRLNNPAAAAAIITMWPWHCLEKQHIVYVPHFYVYCQRPLRSPRRIRRDPRERSLRAK